MKSTTLVAALAAVSLLALAACGGGGGGPTASEPPSSTSGVVAAPVAVTQARGSAASVLDQILFGDAAPRYYQVNVIPLGPPVTGIRTEFSPPAASTTITRGALETVRLLSSDAYQDSGVVPSFTTLPNRSSRTFRTFRQSAGRATIGMIAVDWSNADSGDYLAGGYWIDWRVGAASPSFGAYVSGDELEPTNPPNLPVFGAARYDGPAVGVYGAEYGVDVQGVAPGSIEGGEFVSHATLSADFASGTISGCIGCAAGSTFLTGVFTDSRTGQQREFVSHPTNYQIHLGTTAFNRNGRGFSVGSVQVSSPDNRIRTSSGTWLGQFSNRPTATGEPRLVAGTFMGQGSTLGGSSAVFSGAFAAGKQ